MVRCCVINSQRTVLRTRLNQSVYSSPAHIPLIRLKSPKNWRNNSKISPQLASAPHTGTTLRCTPKSSPQTTLCPDRPFLYPHPATTIPSPSTPTFSQKRIPVIWMFPPTTRFWTLFPPSTNDHLPPLDQFRSGKLVKI